MKLSIKNNRAVKRQLISIIPIVIFGLSLLTAFSINHSNWVEKLPYYNKRTIFTTYFYWYRNNQSNLLDSPHMAEKWTQTDIYDVGNKSFPSNWPGPTDPNDMLVNGFHDALSYHMPADAPSYDIYGNVIGNLSTGILENITDWVSWNNTAFHEWEMRCMIKAGIDVLMPVYWWNGIQHEWSIEGLYKIIEARHQLIPKIVAEADAKEPGIVHNESYADNLIPKISMFFDTTCMKTLWAKLQAGENGTLYQELFFNGSGPDLSNPYWREQFWLRIKDFYDVVGDDDAFKFNENYIVWLYGGGWFADVGETVLDYCKTKFKQEYGKGLLFVGPHDWIKANIDGICDWGACCPGNYLGVQDRGIPVGAVSPGFYNLGAIRVQDPAFYNRDLQKYKQLWQDLIAENPAWIHVETWNELHEGTSICWTQEYGYSFINATREMADIFHQLGNKPSPHHINYYFLIIPLGLLALVMIPQILIIKKKNFVEPSIR
ncbi:MAG: DUF5010 domain-containing protein [Promethearchaeota archaeon]